MASTLKTALVTGAGSGIGRGITATLAELGLRVALVGRDREKLERARAELDRGRDSAFVATCDIADRFAVKAVVDNVLTAFGSVDVLVCNAGTNVKNRSLESIEPPDWDRMIATNLTGSFNLVHALLPSMRQQKNGLVIQICSISGLRPAPSVGRATRPRSSASPRWGSAWDARRGRTASVRRSSTPARSRRRSSTPDPYPSGRTGAR